MHHVMISMEEKPVSGVVYQCLHCDAKVLAEQLLLTTEIKCPNCGYRVLRKVRSPVVKRIKAR
jgi:DNA-directed RNA polymerase subunit RPC12/RpoP